MDVGESILYRRAPLIRPATPPQVVEVAPQLFRRWTRRDLLLFGAGAIAAVAAGGALLPQTTLKRLGIIRGNKNWPEKEWPLNRAIASMRMSRRLCI